MSHYWVSPDQQVVSMAFTRPFRMPLEHRYRFAVKGDHNTRRRQKQYWKWLRKTGAIENAWGEETNRHVVFNQEHLARKIILQAQLELLSTYNIRTQTVYIGREEFSQLISDPEIWKYMPPHGLTLRPQTLFGMEIRVVSHMKGILIV